MSCCYLLHFDEKLHHAQHYIGFTVHETPDKRFEMHKKGRGARLTGALVNRGITFRIARVWPNGDRSLERYLKDKKAAKVLCPICNDKLAEK